MKCWFIGTEVAMRAEPSPRAQSWAEVPRETVSPSMIVFDKPSGVSRTLIGPPVRAVNPTTVFCVPSPSRFHGCGLIEQVSYPQSPSPNVVGHAYWTLGQLPQP